MTKQCLIDLHVDGFSTIEILITFSVGIVFLTAAMMVAFSDPTLAHQISLNNGQTTALDTALDSDALSTSTKTIGTMIATLSKNWNAPINQTSDSFYTTVPVVTDVSPCFKTLETNTTWNTVGRNGRSVTFGTGLASLSIAKGLGGDCDPTPVTESWRKPRVFSSHNFNPGKPLGLDVLNRIVYTTDDKGNLQIYNSSNDVFGSNGTFSITPYTDAAGKNFNDIDVIRKGSRKYAFVVRNAPTGQFQVIDVTNPPSYSVSPQKTLSGATPPTGSFPEGWRVFYFDNRVYATTRETSGREFHIFDVSTPLAPTELGPGFEVNGTINDMLVISFTINGTTYKVAFLATDRSANELMVLNITNPLSPTLLTSIDLPTNNDAYSLQLVGNHLYLGRQKTNGGPELFVYNVTYGQNGSTPTVTFTPIGNGAEINVDVQFLRIAGKFAFLGNNSPNEFKVLDISAPASGFARIDTDPLNVSNKVFSLDYEAPYVYVASQANDALQILYSAP